jgi:glycine/D-amino acid oxidase-like deaminating enzyme
MVAYRCEVVIVGGGILGCWVLRELVTRGYGSTVLLEHDRLSCRQTGHADAFLHHGYAYYSKPLAGSFGDTSASWNRHQSTNPPIPPGTAHHVYLRAAERCVSFEQVTAWHRDGREGHFCKVARVARIVLGRETPHRPLHV